MGMIIHILGTAAYIAAILVWISGCSSPEIPKKVGEFSHIQDKAELYCKLSKPKYDELKYVHNECDSAGFTALYSLACPNNKVDLSVFQTPDFKQYRNPNKDCYPDRSKSEYSKDHLLMRTLAAAYQQDKTWARGFYRYVSNNGGFFCDGVDIVTKLSRCLINPFLSSAVGRVSGDYLPPDSINEGFAPKKGFEGHLEVLNILLRYKLQEGLTVGQMDTLEDYAKKEPLNALYQAAAYKYRRVTKEEVLAAFDNDHWPKDRLPSSSEHCESYLFQRDMVSDIDWKPCPHRKETYQGVDYAFASFILAGVK